MAPLAGPAAGGRRGCWSPWSRRWSLLGVVRLTSDQAALAAVKRQIQADLFEMRLFNDDLRALLRAQGAVLRAQRPLPAAVAAAAAVHGRAAGAGHRPAAGLVWLHRPARRPPGARQRQTWRRASSRRRRRSTRGRHPRRTGRRSTSRACGRSSGGWCRPRAGHARAAAAASTGATTTRRWWPSATRWPGARRCGTAPGLLDAAARAVGAAAAAPTARCTTIRGAVPRALARRVRARDALAGARTWSRRSSFVLALRKPLGVVI